MTSSFFFDFFGSATGSFAAGVSDIDQPFECWLLSRGRQEGAFFGRQVGQHDDVHPAVHGDRARIARRDQRTGTGEARGRHPVRGQPVADQVPDDGTGPRGGQFPRARVVDRGYRQLVGVPVHLDAVGLRAQCRYHRVEDLLTRLEQVGAVPGEHHGTGHHGDHEPALVDGEQHALLQVLRLERGGDLLPHLLQVVDLPRHVGGLLARGRALVRGNGGLRGRIGGGGARGLRAGGVGQVGADVGQHRDDRGVAALAVHDRALRLERDGLGAEPAGQPVRQLGELLLVHLAHREQHDEQHHEQRQHVRVGDQPALVVLVLLVMPTAALLPPRHPLVTHAALAFLSASPGGSRLLSFWATRRGLAPAWIAITPSTASSICSHSSSPIRLSRLPSGRKTTLASMTPQRVATNAPAISSPSLDGSDRLLSTWTRPMMVPMMPMVGANPPMSVKIFAPDLSALRLASISPCRMSLSSSGSVPSMAISRPRRRNGSFTPLAASSSASSPSRRARSASATTASTRSPDVLVLLVKARFIWLTMPVESRSTPPAMAAPRVPRTTRISGAGRMIEAGLPPSMTCAPKMPAKAMPMPMRVARSISAPAGAAGRRWHRARGRSRAPGPARPGTR